MRISDVIKQAQSGELSNLAVKDDIDSIIQFINLGLIALYKRFNLATGEVVIEIGKPTTDADAYAKISNTEYRLPYDAGAVLEAYEEDGTPIPINVEDNPMSILTPSWNTIQVPVATNGAYISIIYSKDPDRITYSEAKPATYSDDITRLKLTRNLTVPDDTTLWVPYNEIDQNGFDITLGTNSKIVYDEAIRIVEPAVEAVDPILPLPSSLLEALLHYIGYRGHGAVDGNVDAENNTHLIRFNAECENVKKLGAVTADDMTSSSNLSRKGFV